MRRARITYPGAFHHAMNRGHGGTDIFFGNKNKSQFLDFLSDSAKKFKIRIFAYTVMNNHYHLVLENTSGKMSEFMKRLNGLYGTYYRAVTGGKGYVFQERFKSTLIEKDSYLLQSIAYLLRNPLRACIVPNAEDYTWSSVKAYFSNTNSNDKIVDHEFVNELFGTKEELLSAIYKYSEGGLPVRITRFGEVLGSEDFLKSAIPKYNRRKRPTDQSTGRGRKDERYFEPVEKVIREFEMLKKIIIEDIDATTHKGKRHRGELLVWLKDRSGLTYKEISQHGVFFDVHFDTLRDIYRRMKARIRINSKES
jgi:REP element-mobilizing transposase RayT